MKATGREEEGQDSSRKSPPPARKRSIHTSSSRLDGTDKEMLSLARRCPLTISSMCRRMDISLVECLHRSGKLQQMGLLKRAEDLPDSDGLYLYTATEEAHDIVQRHAPNSSESGVGTT